MILNLMLGWNIFSNIHDIVFFSAIGIVLLLGIIVFIVSKVVQNKRDKQYAEMEAAAKAAAEKV